MDIHTIQQKLDFRADTELRACLTKAYDEVLSYSEGLYKLEFKHGGEVMNGYAVLAFFKEYAFKQYQQQNRDRVTKEFLVMVEECNVQLDSLNDENHTS